MYAKILAIVRQHTIKFHLCIWTDTVGMMTLEYLKLTLATLGIYNCLNE